MPIPTDQEIGAELKKRREGHAMSQAELVEKTNARIKTRYPYVPNTPLNQTQLSKYENGNEPINPAHLYCFADVLHCHVSNFYGLPAGKYYDRASGKIVD